jgi:hypothetical protein
MHWKTGQRLINPRLTFPGNGKESLMKAINESGSGCHSHLLAMMITDSSGHWRNGLRAILLAFATVSISLRPLAALASPSQQAYVKASNTGAFDGFGLAVDVSGNTLVVGAPFESSNATGVNGNQGNNSAAQAGAAYVFVRNGTNWSQQAYLKASNTEAGDNFGFSVAVSGDTIVIGAPYESSSATSVNGNQADNSASASGAAYVFVRNGSNWSQQAYLKASNTDSDDEFGYSVAILGDSIVVGAPYESSNATGVNGNQTDNSASASGAAYVFVRNGSNWSQQAYLKASNTDYGDEFGGSAAISGDIILVGAKEESSSATGVNGNQTDNSAFGSGAAYVFVRNGMNWSQQAYLKASNTRYGDLFAFSVAVSGDSAVVGAREESSSATGVNGNQSDHSAPGSGAAYVFVRDGTTWTQQAYLKASNTEAEDQFGTSVAISGDTISIGAFGEDSSATGVNGAQGNNSAASSGAAYVFVRSGTNWSQQAYLKASNTDAGDYFAWSVTISGDTVVAGAGDESSGAVGINGNQSDNSALEAGAAYVFSGLGFGPRLNIVPDRSGGYFIRFNGIPYFTYRLQRAPSLTGPWTRSAPQTAPASGLIEIWDPFPPPSQAFYRAVQQ